MPQTIESVYSGPVIKKGRKLLDDDRVHRQSGETIRYIVQGSEEYSVSVVPAPKDEDGETIETDLPWVVCGCPNGLARGGRPNCYHSAAVLLALRDEVDELTKSYSSDADEPHDVERTRVRLLAEHGFTGDPRVVEAREREARQERNRHGLGAYDPLD